MDWKHLLFTHQGRIGPKPYWMALGVIMATSFVAAILDGAIFGWASNRGPLSSIVGLACLYPQFALTVKRLHDLNRSGWWQLAPFAVLVAVGVLSVRLSASGPAAGGVVGALLLAVLVLAALGMYLWIAVFPGTPGPNRYGEPESGSRKIEPLAEVFS